jgi:hypothetical protein
MKGEISFAAGFFAYTHATLSFKLIIIENSAIV